MGSGRRCHYLAVSGDGAATARAAEQLRRSGCVCGGAATSGAATALGRRQGSRQVCRVYTVCLSLSSLTRRCSHASDLVECGATIVAQPPRPEPCEHGLVRAGESSERSCPRTCLSLQVTRTGRTGQHMLGSSLAGSGLHGGAPH